MDRATDRLSEIADESGPVDDGYAAWKRAKVERGLAQARDRSTMIPVERLIDELGLER